jgi:hypothetical protein
MNPLHDLSAIDVLQWRELHRRALAAGGGWTVPPELERLAATDELAALAVPELVRLAMLAVCTEGPREPSPECASALSGNAAGVVRLLDRALAADGRDTGYPVEAWRERVFQCAPVRGLAVSRLPLERVPLGTLVEARRRRRPTSSCLCTVTASASQRGSPTRWRRCSSCTPPESRSVTDSEARAHARSPRYARPGGEPHRGERCRPTAGVVVGPGA